MTHTYQITGMTCNGCADAVKNLLSKATGVTAVKVDLAKQQAEVTMEYHISTGQLEAALGGTKYHISEQLSSSAQPAMQMEEEEPVTLKTYLPIFLLFAYITGVTLLVQIVKGSFDAEEWMRHFMAGFFLSFSFFKLLDIPAFAMGYSSYDVIAKRWNGYGYVYPFIELGLGIAFLIPAAGLWANAVTLLVMGVSSIGVIQSMLRKSKIQCACVGTVFKLPVGKVTLFEDALMVIMSAVSLAMYWM